MKCGTPTTETVDGAVPGACEPSVDAGVGRSFVIVDGEGSTSAGASRGRRAVGHLCLSPLNLANRRKSSTTFNYAVASIMRKGARVASLLDRFCSREIHIFAFKPHRALRLPKARFFDPDTRLSLIQTSTIAVRLQRNFDWLEQISQRYV